MLAHDFLQVSKWKFEIFWFDKNSLDIRDLKSIKEKVEEVKPDVILNLAAYTAVDHAEDIWMKLNYDINSLWVYNLAKVTAEKNIDLITISTDYVFDWKSENWYDENHPINPVNQYWVAKYLWEKLAKEENDNSIIIRTSWLYGWWKEFKNFVNTMLKLWKEKNELKIINDQFWSPTNCIGLSRAICDVIENIWENRWKVFHFSNETEWNWVSWFDFANEIFSQSWIDVKTIACDSSEYKTKATRPSFSKLINNSSIKMQGWKSWLRDYLENLRYTW